MKKMIFFILAIACTLTATAQTQLIFVPLDFGDDMITWLLKEYWYWLALFIGGSILFRYLLGRAESQGEEDAKKNR